MKFGGGLIVIVGIPKEIKDDECRVSQIPASVQVLTEAGHRVLVEQGAGEPSGFGDDEYLKAGAELITDGAEVFNKSEMVLKVLPGILPTWLYFLLKIRRGMWRV